VAAREAESTGYQGLAPVTSAFKAWVCCVAVNLLSTFLRPLWRQQRQALPLPLTVWNAAAALKSAQVVPTHNALQRCDHSECCPLATQDIATLPELAGAIGSAIEESGAVRESASEDVRRARGRVRTIEGRLRGILKVGWSGWEQCGCSGGGG